MNKTSNILLAGIAGTTVMTIFSYLVSAGKKRNYSEPVLLARHVKRTLPAQPVPYMAAGWALHYLTGVAFMEAFRLAGVHRLKGPAKVLVPGIASGVAGIAVWKLLFALHPETKPRNIKGFYRQLLAAHIVFCLPLLVMEKKHSRSN